MMRYLSLLVLLFSSIAQAAISKVASDTTNNGSNLTQSCTVDKPAGTAEGNFILFYVSVADSVVDVTDITSPSGITEIYEVETSNGQNRRVLAAYKVAGSSEPTTYQFTGDGGDDERWECGVTTLAGTAASQLDATFSSGSHYFEVENSAHTQNPPSVTTTTDGAWVIVLQFVSHNDVTATGPSSGYTELDSLIFDGSTSHRNWFVQYKEVATAGVEDPGAVSHTENGTNANDGSMFIIAVKPQISAGQEITLVSASETGIGGVPTDTVGDTTSGSAIITGMDDAALFAPGYEVTVSSGFSCSPYCAVLATTSTSITLDEAATSTVSNVTTTRRAYFDPALSTDTIDLDTETSGGCAFTFATDGDFSYSGCSGLQTIEYCPQGARTTPSCTWETTNATFYINNTPPELDLTTSGDDVIVLVKDVAMDAVNFVPSCTDANGHTMTLDFVKGTIPTGLTLSSGELSGTPTVENEAGEAMTLRCTDQGGLVDYETTTIYVLETVPMPEVDDESRTSAINTILTAQPWRLSEGDTGITVDDTCNNSEAADQVLSQDPVATTEMAAYDAIVLDVATLSCNFINTIRGRQ